MNRKLDLFIEAYSQANQSIKDLIDSEKIGQFAETIQTNQGDFKQKRELIVVISNRILSLISDSEMVDELEGVGVTTDKIAQTKAFIEKALKDSVETEITEIPTTPNPVNETAAEKIIINPLRTMASDGKEVGYQSTEEPVYTSVQNAIINESKWGSDDGK